METKSRVDKHYQTFSKTLSKNIKIGLTGSFGSGKSTVLEICKKIGFETYSADKEVHKLYSRKEIQNKIMIGIPEAFSENKIGEKILCKEKLREIIFSNNEKLSFLEKVIHPIIKEQCISLIKLNKKKSIFEIPILLKSGLQKHFDKIITLEAEQKIRIERILKRYKNTFSEINFLAIEKTQPSEKERRLIADIVIKNNGTIDELEKKIFTFLKN